MHVYNTKRSLQHISNSSWRSRTMRKCVFVLALALFAFMQYFIQTAQHNVLVTLHDIRKLHSMAPCGWVFHPLTSSLVRVLLGRAVTPRSWWDGGDRKRRSSLAESDSHYQLRLFLFLFTATINHTVSGSRGERESKTERGRERERGKREREGNFHQKELAIQTSEMNCAAEPDSQRASWKHCGQMKIYTCLMGRGWVTGDN